jgi:WD40 repeat protein
VARLGTLRFRRVGDGFVDRPWLAYLPDGKTLLTAQEDGKVQLWDAATGRLLREVATSPLLIRGSFALAPDGKRIAASGYHDSLGNQRPDGEIRVLDLASGKGLHSFARDNRDVSPSTLVFSPDGKLLFSLGGKGTLRVEEVASGKQLLQRQFPADSPHLALSSDGQYLAVATGPNTHKLFLWKWQGEEPRPLELPPYGASRISFAPSAKLLAAIGHADQGLRVWDVPSGRLRYQWAPSADGSYLEGEPTFTPDGKLVLVSVKGRPKSRGQIQILDAESGRPQGTLPNTSGTMAVSPDSRHLAVSQGRGLRFWDLRSRQALSAKDEAHWHAPSHILISPRGLVVTASDDNTARIWDAATGKQRRMFSLDNWVRAIGLSLDGKVLAASSFDDAVHVWDTDTGQEIYRLAGHGRSGGHRTLGFLPDGRGLLSWGDDFYLRLWDMKTGKARFEHAIRPQGVTILDDDDFARKEAAMLKRLQLSFGNATISPDCGTFVLDIAGAFHWFDVPSGKEKFTVPHDRSISTSMTISPDSKYLLTSAWGAYQVGNHPVSLWDLASGKTAWRTTVPGTIAGPVGFTADGRAFAVTAHEPQAKILVYETASGEVRCTIREIRGRIYSLAFFPDGRRLVSGLNDSTLLIWDLTSPQRP